MRGLLHPGKPWESPSLQCENLSGDRRFFRMAPRGRVQTLMQRTVIYIYIYIYVYIFMYIDIYTYKYI